MKSVIFIAFLLGLLPAAYAQEAASAAASRPVTTCSSEMVMLNGVCCVGVWVIPVVTFDGNPICPADSQFSIDGWREALKSGMLGPHSRVCFRVAKKKK